MTRAFNFGAKLAASSCSPCDMPNSPTNKKHMTGASPAVTEAGEHSEEIGKPEVVETEHSEAEAKQPEEGIKSAANFGKMLGGLFGAAKPAVDNAAQAATAAVRKPIVGQFPPPAPTKRMYRFQPGKRPDAVPPPPAPPASSRSPAEMVRAKELGLQPSDYVDGTPFATPNPSPARSSVPVRQTNKVVTTDPATGAPLTLSGGNKSVSYVTANRDARATALSKAKSARPGVVPPVPAAPKTPAQRAADDFNYGRTPLAPLPKKPAVPPVPAAPKTPAQRAADDFNYGRTPLAPLPKKPAPPPAELTLE